MQIQMISNTEIMPQEIWRSGSRSDGIKKHTNRNSPKWINGKYATKTKNGTESQSTMIAATATWDLRITCSFSLISNISMDEAVRIRCS